MGRIVVATVFATLAFTACACGPAGQVGDIVPTKSGTSVAAKDNLTDTTEAACASAIPMSKARVTASTKDVNDLFMAAALDGREAGERALKAFRNRLLAWSEQLAALTDQPIDSDVKAALTDASRVVLKLADPKDNTPVGAAVTNLTDAVENLETTCAESGGV